nr:copia protein [Tanacetum cinerariifolium]
PNPEVALIESFSRPPLTDTILEIPIPQPTGPVIDITPPEQPESPLVVPKADKVHRDPDEPIRVPYEMGKYTNSQMMKSKDKEEKIKKVNEEAKLLDMSKPELIKVVQEEATMVGVDPKILASAKGGQEVTKIPEELGIQSALPAPVQAQSQSLGRKIKHIELEPEIRVPGLECNKSLLEGVPFVNNMVIKQHKYAIFFIDVFGDEAFQRLSDINKVVVDALLTYLVMTSNITTPENIRFYLKLKKAY